MGYSHYWYLAPGHNAEKWAAFVADCRNVCAKLDLNIGIDGSPLAPPPPRRGRMRFTFHIL